MSNKLTSARRRGLLCVIGFVEGNFPAKYLEALFYGMNDGSYARFSIVESTKEGGELERKIVMIGRPFNSDSTCPFLHGYSYSYGYSCPFGGYQEYKIYSLIFLLDREQWKICKPIEKGGASIRDLSDLKKSFHMKFIWRVMINDNIWSIFFKATYIKSGHLATSNPTPTGSRF